MNKKELKHIVDCNAGKMIEKLGLGRWRIKFRYGLLNKCVNGKTMLRRGACACNIRTKRAWITFDLQELTTKKEVISTLRHELAHLITDTFDEYRRVIYKFIMAASSPATKREFAILDEVFHSVQEEITYDICRILERR